MRFRMILKARTDLAAAKFIRMLARRGQQKFKSLLEKSRRAATQSDTMALNGRPAGAIIKKARPKTRKN